MQPIPVLRALRLPATAHQDETTIAWCPFCEEDHHHGRGGGHRAAHCSLPNTPYRATGYDLDIQGEGAIGASAAPDVPRTGQGRLRDALENAAIELRRALLRSTVGGRLGRVFDKKIGSSRISVYGHAWSIDRDAFWDGTDQRHPRPSRPVWSGRDFITLLATLYGVDVGIVGLRLLESVSGASFDVEGRRAIVSEIEAAYARQTERRDARS